MQPVDMDKVLVWMCLTTCLLDFCPSWLVKLSQRGFRVTRWVQGDGSVPFCEQVVPDTLKAVMVWALLGGGRQPWTHLSGEGDYVGSGWSCCRYSWMKLII